MDDERPLDERVAALERAVTDGYADDGLPDAGRLAARVDDLEATVEELDDRTAELDAAVQALRGFAGGVRAVDEAVERRANAAISRIDRLEAELESVAAELPEGGALTGSTDTDHRETESRPRDGADGGVNAGGRDGPTDERFGGHSTDRDGGATRGETLRETVTARSDAALAEVGASDERTRSELDDDPSLADRLRRLL
jgi:hypothetical protein